MTNTADGWLQRDGDPAKEKTITVLGFDECDVLGCANFADIILETANHYRFCTACIEAARTVADSETVTPRWWKVILPPEYQLKKNSVTFLVRRLIAG